MAKVNAVRWLIWIPAANYRFEAVRRVKWRPTDRCQARKEKGTWGEKAVYTSIQATGMYGVSHGSL